MVNGVNGSHYQNPYEQNRIRGKDNTKDAPPFLLNYDEKGVVWEREEKKETVKDTKADVKKQSAEAVAIKGTAADQKADSVLKTNSTPEPLSAGIKQVLEQIFSGIRKIWEFIWYGDEKDKKENEATAVESDRKVTEEQKSAEVIAPPAKNQPFTYEAGMSDEQKDKVIRELLKKKDTEGIMTVLTDNYSKIPAKNSSLLSSYNRHGQMVEIDPMSARRILEGDKSLKF